MTYALIGPPSEGLTTLGRILTEQQDPSAPAEGRRGHLSDPRSQLAGTPQQPETIALARQIGGDSDRWAQGLDMVFNLRFCTSRRSVEEIAEIISKLARSRTPSLTAWRSR